MKRFELEYSAEDFGVMDWGVMRAATPMGCYNCVRLKGAGEILREILSSRIRTKSGGACSIGTGKGVSGSGSPRDRNGVENGGREDATFLRPPW